MKTKPKCSCYGGFDCEVCNPDKYDEQHHEMTTDTPRTDACPHCGSPRISPLCAYFTCVADTTQRDEDKRTHLCREREKSQKLEAEVEELTNKYFDMEAACADHMEEVERLKELLNRAINEIEKIPFHTPKLTAFSQWPIDPTNK